MLLQQHVRNLACGLVIAGSTGVLTPTIARSAGLDENIVTAYTALPTSVTWNVMGEVSQRSSGTLGPFSRACAILEGKPSTSGNVLTRNLYILDAGSGSGGSVVLNVYTKTDTITTSGGSTSDTVSVVLTQQVTLSLTSQAGSTCYVAGNDSSVFIGTSANNTASIVDKATLAQSSVSSAVAANAGPVTQITASDAGTVFVTFGTGPNAGFAQFDDQSNYVAAGQFFNFTILGNTTNAVVF